MLLTDEQWLLLQPLFPPPSPAARGRPPTENRLILDAILWKLAADCPWYDLPSDYPPFQTCYRHYHLWNRSGLLDECLRALYRDLRSRGGLDLEQVFRSGEIAFVRQGNRGAFHCAPHLRDTWQFYTALIFLGIGEKLRRTAPYKLFRYDQFP